MRTFSLGSDRYTRSYWFLPNSGGIFVEGMDASTLSVKKAQKLSVIEEGSAAIINPVGSKRKLSVKAEHCDDDDVFEKPVKKIKESETGAAPTNFPVMPDASCQTNSHNEVTLNHTHSPTSSPSPCNDPHSSSSTDCTLQSKSAHTKSPQPMRSCVITGHGSQSPEEARDNSVDQVTEDYVSTQCTEDTQQHAQNSMYVNAQPTVAYLSNGQLVYSTMPQSSVQYVVPHQGGGYMLQDPSIQTGQLIQGPDGIQYLAVHPQNNMMTQAFIQMENGEQQLCMVANGGLANGGTVDDGNIYTMTVPPMEAFNNEIESLPYRNDILLLMLELPVLRQPAKEEKDTGPSLGELLAHVDPSKCSVVTLTLFGIVIFVCLCYRLSIDAHTRTCKCTCTHTHTHTKPCCYYRTHYYRYHKWMETDYVSYGIGRGHQKTMSEVKKHAALVNFMVHTLNGFCICSAGCP